MSPLMDYRTYAYALSCLLQYYMKMRFHQIAIHNTSSAIERIERIERIENVDKRLWKPCAHTIECLRCATVLWYVYLSMHLAICAISHKNRIITIISRRRKMCLRMHSVPICTVGCTAVPSECTHFNQVSVWETVFVCMPVECILEMFDAHSIK